jgi:hypothetical protein
MCKPRYVVAAIAVTLIVCLAQGAMADAWAKMYDASLGTLPEAQGWTASDTGGSAVPHVSGDVLYQGPTSVGGYQSWSSTSVDSDFMGTFALEAQLAIDISGKEDLGSTWRTGYSRDGFRVANDYGWSDSASTAWVPQDCGPMFNTYRFEVSGGVGSLYYNGMLQCSLAVGDAVPAYAANQVSFGDNTASCSTEARLRYLAYGNAVPEPSSLLALLAGGVGLLARRRR